MPQRGSIHEASSPERSRADATDRVAGLFDDDLLDETMTCVVKSSAARVRTRRQHMTTNPESIAEQVPEVPQDTLERELVRRRLRSRMFGSEEPGVHVDRFVLLEQIGAGGMGQVYAAWDEQLARRVALKLLRNASEKAHVRLLREAQAQARVSHPNVVPIYEAGVDTGGEAGVETGGGAGRLWLAMEYVEGVTLREWYPSAPDWRAVLAVLIECGRGLEAAHRAGLVHRDFKPANVMIGPDARPRVLDFGLARGIGASPLSSIELSNDEEEVTWGSGSSDTRGMLDRSVTVQGSLLGTPAYMAPEQHEGQRADVLSDQFSFCVTAFECLFGQRPFSGKTLGALSRAILAGEIRPIPRDTKVPRRVSDALLRGLTVDPAQRWPSMSALLEQLHTAATPQRGWAWGSVAVVVLGLGVALGVTVADTDAPARCSINADALAGSWDDGRREQLRAALGASKLASADATAKVVSAEFDRWGERFVAAQRDACEATHVRGVQSGELLDRRSGCLERQRREFNAVVQRFITAEAAVADATALLGQLPDLGRCDLAHLDDAAALPSDPDAAAAVLAGFERLADARVRLISGDREGALEICAELEVSPAAAQHAPLALGVEALLAQNEALAGEPKAVAKRLQAAIGRAAELGLTDIEADLRVELAHQLAGAWTVPEAEQLLVDEAALALRRVGAPQDQRWIEIESARASVSDAQGHYDEAILAYERALDLAETAGEPDLTQILIGLANTLRKAGDDQRAGQVYDQAAAHVIGRWGEDGPDSAKIEFNRGLLALDTGETERATAHLERARGLSVAIWGEQSRAVADVDFAVAKLALQQGELGRGRALCEAIEPIYLRTLGPNHQETGRLLNALGVFRFFEGDYQGSLEAYQRALVITSRSLGEHHEEVGQLHSNIGESQLALGRSLEASESFARALKILEPLSWGDGEQSRPQLALPLKGRGLALLEAGTPDDAAPLLERALDIHERHGQEPLEQAATRFALARALGARDSERARALAQVARDEYEALGQTEDVGVVTDWLESLQLGSGF
ncbi:protein kinase domain-containing protein [Enhygromyxa salina]|uniref:Serine/threonine-protein kinase PrkC n=1 Tax=Enhygromyxa salina TaxID=215803 RepID=A0A2S9Y7S2_9BACT|nr:serine/threonine-protein kinase [Enhygromyxa salina]PRQ01153.1 Serine/threonine-protein kinase PrkC [Enhygromyxa salina]